MSTLADAEVRQVRIREREAHTGLPSAGTSLSPLMAGE
jgi:hypothetical protein